ncbi:MAG: hypothetical protein IJH79_13520, partial [Lentisphaeria bacterium]|nr:hypothetical protein [Lentisphaeria bacterium]
MPGSLKDNWDEFDWEKELRKDDERVAAYMDELPRYIDLPSEDAVIMKHLKEKPGLVPPDGDYNGTFLDNIFEDDFESEDDFTEDWQKKDGAEFYIAASRLSRLWAQFYAVQTDPKITVPAIKILCLYGKIMARSGDLIDMADDDYVPLRIALVKRLLADVNELMGLFTALRETFPDSGDYEECADFHFEGLMTFREKLFTLLKKYRT